ncbi:substrate-binding domain-containing protein [Fundidesulfovibrio terrae]|uniref:substrate-binding domain-containing protein n=1 Tax=Fundidesulfovibrio terrae TaxID=2922866 RepID=UPI001FB009D6|nr:substrate-binding domain-containing protein [Fundidesulfovibrio terrae]
MKRRSQAMMLCVLVLSLVTNAAAETLVIPGSGNPEYVLDQLAKAFNSRQKRHQVVIPETIGTAGAVRAVTDGTATLARVGRPLKEAELAGGVLYCPLGRDPVVFVGGAGVSVGTVTMDQMLDIYTGKLTNWRELGGNPGTIRAIGREVTDASRQAIGRGVAVFADLKLHEGVKVVHLDSQMIELLDRFPNSVGFLNRSALSAAKTKLVYITLDSMGLNVETLESGRYPFWIEFGLIYKERTLTEAGREFLDFVNSPEGKDILRMHGVMPVASMHVTTRAGQ